MKKLKLARYAVSTVVAATLLTSAALPPTYASEAATEVSNLPVVQEAPQYSVFDVPSVGTVPINTNSYFELKDLRLTTGSENDTVTFTVNVVNGGVNDLLFIDYWVRMQSLSGANYTINIVPQDKDKNLIPAGGAQEIKFYAQITSGVNLQDLQFQFIRWDFSAANYQRVLGTLQVNENYSTVAPAYSKANLKIAKTGFQGYVKEASLDRNEDFLLPTVVWELRNTDSRSVTLPKMTYMIRTADGLLYPLTSVSKEETMTVNPLMAQEIKLSGKLPLEISEDNWELVVMEQSATGGEAGAQTTLAEFRLPAFTEGIPITEKVQKFTNHQGKYSAELEKVQRMPWEDKDLLTASIILKSDEAKSVPIPELIGYMELDNSVKVEIQVIRTDNIIGLQPNSEVRIQVMGVIPYTYEYSELKIVLQEKQASNTEQSGASTLVSFALDATIDPVPAVSLGESYKLGGQGRSAQYAIQAITKYESSSSELIVAHLEVENLERRATDISKLVAHFQTADGTTYPATLTEIKMKISPSGKALLQVWANIAKSRSSDISQLLIGEGITKNQYSGPTEMSDAYVNSVVFNLPQDPGASSDTIKDIAIFPYTLSMSRVGTSVNDGKVKLEFDYELEKDLQYVVNPENYKINIEIVDGDHKAKMDWTLDVDTSKDEDKGATGTSPIDPSRLVLGINKMELTKTDADFIYKTSYLKDFHLNIYTVFQGQKRLVATKTLGWFYFND